MALKYLYVPSGYKAGTAYGVLPNVANADFAFVRGSAGTRVNADGLLESEITNVPRLDYTDGTCPTLLTEPASTNLLHNSGWEGGGALPTNWNYSFSTGTSTSVTSTKGTTINAYRFQTTSTRQVISRTFTSAVSTTYTLSVYVESVTGSLQARDILYKFNGGGTFIWRKDGVVVTENETIVSGSFYSITFTATLAESIVFRLGVGVIDVSTGDVTLSQPQVEELPYRTSFMISPIGAIATRSADTGVISGDLSSYLNSSEGVLEIKAKALFNGGSSVRIAVSNGTADNRINLIWTSSSNTMQLGIKSNGNNVLDGGNTFSENFTHDQTQMATFKIKWKSGDIQVKMNEEVVITDTSSFSGLVLNRLRLDAGYGSASNLFEGNVQYIKVYDSATDF